MKKLKSTLLLVLFVAVAAAQDKSAIPLIGDKATEFRTQSTNGVVNFPEDFGTNWKLIISHPQDFTPVCSSELLELASMQEEFENLNVDIMVISTDSLEMHYRWKEALEQVNYNNSGSVEINYPMLTDRYYKISKQYGMVHPKVSTNRNIRGVFVIDPENIVRFVQFYPIEIGRNMEEIKRVVIALQTYDEHEVHTPANWEPGDDVLLPYPPEDMQSNPNIYQTAWFMTYKKFAMSE